MRYIVFSSALILSLELLGTSIATAMPADGSAIVKANANSKETVQVSDGCGSHRGLDPAARLAGGRGCAGRRDSRGASARR